MGSIAADTNISGYGTVAISISTAGSITANGGLLDLQGVITGRTLVIDSSAPAVLKIGGTATASSIAINSSYQTLEVGASGSLTVLDRRGDVVAPALGSRSTRLNDVAVGLGLGRRPARPDQPPDR